MLSDLAELVGSAVGLLLGWAGRSDLLQDFIGALLVPFLAPLPSENPLPVALAIAMSGEALLPPRPGEGTSQM
jgi:hypothetical protein